MGGGWVGLKGDSGALPATQEPTPDPSIILGVTATASTTGRVVFVRLDGSLVLYNLATGSERQLLDVGLFDRLGDEDLPPARLSPDGRWLLVPTLQNGTWLVSLDGQAQRKIHDEPLDSTWAPDSQRIVFAQRIHSQSGNGGSTVYIQNVVADEDPRRVTQLSGVLRFPTWSPGCDPEITTAYGDCTQLVAAQTYEADIITIWLIDVATGTHRVLGQYPARQTSPARSVFRWSANGAEVRYWDTAFPVSDNQPQPVVEATTPDEGVVSPDGRLRAVIKSWDGAHAQLTISRTDSDASITFERIFANVHDLPHWTGNGRRVLLNSSEKDRTGPSTLWAVDPAVGQFERIAEHIGYLGTLYELQQRSTEVDEQTTLRVLPAPGEPTTWRTRTLADLGIRLRVPPEWRFEVQERDEEQVATLANFNFMNPRGSVSLDQQHPEITFHSRHVGGMPSDFAAWLSRLRKFYPFATTIERTTVDGQPAARIRRTISPVSEEIYVPLIAEETEFIIRYQPLTSTHDIAMERVIDSLEFFSPDEVSNARNPSAYSSPVR